MRPYKPRLPGSAHDALANMVAQIGESQVPSGNGMQMFADFEDRSINTLYHELDPAGPSQVSYARVARAVSHFKVRAPADHMAACAGGIFVKLPEPGKGRWGELTAETAEEMGQVTAEIVRDLLTGEVTPAAARHLLPELFELVRHLSDLVALAQSALGEGGHAG
jgi:hypothetical protein